MLETKLYEIGNKVLFNLQKDLDGWGKKLSNKGLNLGFDSMQNESFDAEMALALAEKNKIVSSFEQVASLSPLDREELEAEHASRIAYEKVISSAKEVLRNQELVFRKPAKLDIPERRTPKRLERSRSERKNTPSKRISSEPVEQSNALLPEIQKLNDNSVPIRYWNDLSSRGYQEPELIQQYTPYNIYASPLDQKVGKDFLVSLGIRIVEKTIEKRRNKRKIEEQQETKEELAKLVEKNIQMIQKISTSVDSFKERQKNRVLKEKLEQKIQYLSDLEESAIKLQVFKQKMASLSAQRTYSRSVEPLKRFAGNVKQEFSAFAENTQLENSNEISNSKTERMHDFQRMKKYPTTDGYRSPHSSEVFSRMRTKVHSPLERMGKQAYFLKPPYFEKPSNLPLSSHLQLMQHLQTINLSGKY